MAAHCRKMTRPRRNGKAPACMRRRGLAWSLAARPAGCPAGLRLLDQLLVPDARLKFRFPGSSCVPGLPPAWCPSPAVTYFYCPDGGWHKGFPGVFSRLFSRPQGIHSCHSVVPRTRHFSTGLSTTSPQPGTLSSQLDRSLMSVSHRWPRARRRRAEALPEGPAEHDRGGIMQPGNGKAPACMRCRGPARSLARWPAGCPAGWRFIDRLLVPDTRVKRRFPGSPCVPGLPPGWCPSPAVTYFYCPGRVRHKGLRAVFSRLFSCPQRIHKNSRVVPRTRHFSTSPSTASST
jgi:hypothetical protein